MKTIRLFPLLLLFSFVAVVVVIIDATPLIDLTKVRSTKKQFLSPHHQQKDIINNNNIPSDSPGSFTLIYKTSWQQSYLHYNADNHGWNGIPGAKMSCNSNFSAQYPCSQGYDMITVWGNAVTFVTTNGEGQWDNDGGKNYEASSPGVWLLQSENLKQLSSAPTGCPDACSNHGTCNPQSYTCECDAGYFGVTCQFQCPSSCTVNLHEVCSNTNGNCVCQSGWAKCSGGHQSGCMTNISSDVENCGSCGNNCNNQPNVVSATCSNGKCVVQCKSGFIACDDGTCRTTCPLPGCNTYQLTDCSGNQINTSTNFSNNNWPPTKTTLT